MHDGITLEQLGVRTVVLCTQPFEVTGNNIARVMGIPDYPFVVLDHPLGSINQAAIEKRAASAFEQGIKILTE